MGTGIAYVGAVVAKLEVIMVDVSSSQIASATTFLDKLLAKDVAKGKLTQSEMDSARKRFRTDITYSALQQVDFVVEAVSEQVELKRKIFGELCKVTRPGVVLATNTSSISISKIAAATTAPDRVIGMHFMNPVPIMKLIEVISGLATSANTLATTLALSKAMGKITTHSKDIPGFIANRLLMPYINEAVYALQEGIASRDDIDTTMKLGTNVPMGPLQLADFIGLDTCLAIMQVLHRGLGDDKYRPAPLLQQYVDAGWLGKKSRKGFYEYHD